MYEFWDYVRKIGATAWVLCFPASAAYAIFTGNPGPVIAYACANLAVAFGVLILVFLMLIWDN